MDFGAFLLLRPTPAACEMCAQLCNFMKFCETVCAKSVCKNSNTMATISFYLDSRRPNKEGLSPLKLVITHKRKRVFKNLKIYLTIEQWDGNHVTQHPQKKMYNQVIKVTRLEYESKLLKLQSTMRLDDLSVEEVSHLLEAENDYIQPSKCKYRPKCAPVPI